MLGALGVEITAEGNCVGLEIGPGVETGRVAIGTLNGTFTPGLRGALTPGLG